MPSNEDEGRRIENEERVRQILEPQGDEGRGNQREALATAEQQLDEATDQDKTKSFRLCLQLALVGTALFAAVGCLLVLAGY